MKTLALSLLALAFLYGCASHDSSHDAKMAADTTGVSSDVASDPVSTAEVRKDGAWSTYWKGNWYYFESAENLRRFEANPASYVGDDGRARPERRKVYPHEVR
jgi:YHS domain-containing protein